MFKINYALIAVFSILVVTNTNAEKLQIAGGMYHGATGKKFLGVDTTGKPMITNDESKAADVVISYVWEQPAVTAPTGYMLAMGASPLVLVTIALNSKDPSDPTKDMLKYLACDNNDQYISWSFYQNDANTFWLRSGAPGSSGTYRSLTSPTNISNKSECTLLKQLTNRKVR